MYLLEQDRVGVVERQHVCCRLHCSALHLIRGRVSDIESFDTLSVDQQRLLFRSLGGRLHSCRSSHWAFDRNYLQVVDGIVFFGANHHHRLAISDWRTRHRSRCERPCYQPLSGLRSRSSNVLLRLGHQPVRRRDLSLCAMQPGSIIAIFLWGHHHRLRCRLCFPLLVGQHDGLLVVHHPSNHQRLVRGSSHHS